MNDSMRQLVQVVNRLQDACLRSQVPLGLELPQICVVGGQSVGKSSVLESIVGKDFLPRGTGIVTRCPLILKCKQCDEEYAEFLHAPGQIFNDFDHVRHEIQAQTERLCGANKGITDKAISLTIHTPHVLDLTLVDLPGITRVAVGDQPEDIEAQTLDLVLKHVTHPNVIILAVSAANVDLANSDAMKVVRQVDPDGKRTIGVITKLDIMDRGTDARDVLTNTIFRLKLGYIGVVNRSQADIDGDVPVKQVRGKEARFFEQSYSDLADRMGIPHLQKVLNRELTAHIEKTLPELMSRLKTKHKTTEDHLNSLQHVVQTENVLDRSLHDYGRLIETELQGKTGHVHMDDIGGGAKINSLFYKEFIEILDLSNFILNEEDFNQKIEVVIRNLRAINNGVFVPDEAFNALTSRIIEKYQEPVTMCVDLAGALLREITAKAGHLLDDYPRLRETVELIINSHIDEQENIAKKHLIAHVKAEASFKNTRHEDYLSTVSQQSLPAIPGGGTAHRGKQVIPHRGRVLFKLRGKDADGWFVLTSDTLKCFRNDQEDEDLFIIHLDSKFRVRKENGGNHKKVVLLRADGRNVTHDCKVLEMVFKDDVSADSWAQRFYTSGIFPEGEDYEVLEPKQEQRRVPNPNQAAQMSRQTVSTRRSILTKVGPSDDEVETVKQMVKCYMGVVTKTIQDIVPKHIVYLLVLDTQEFAARDLSACIRTNYDPRALLERDPHVQEKIERLMREQATSEDALRIIKDYYAYTHSADL